MTTGRQPGTWDAVVEQMLRELASGGPRAESFWAQQLAYAPVLIHALRCRRRRAELTEDQTRLLIPCLLLACGGLGALPDPPWPDPGAVRRTASRQVRALGWNRRRLLERLLSDLGASAPDRGAIAPSRMLRPYDLIGFHPGERYAG